MIYRRESRELPSGMLLEKVVVNSRIIRYELVYWTDRRSKLALRITREEYDALFPLSLECSEQEADE